MTRGENEKAFVQGLRQVLNETEVQTAPHVRMRLRSARLKALEALEKPLPWYARVPRWATAGGLATAMVLVLSLFLWTSNNTTYVPTGQVEDLEILTTQEQLELYKDLDFYRWLETTDHTG